MMIFRYFCLVPYPRGWSVRCRRLTGFRFPIDFCVARLVFRPL